MVWYHSRMRHNSVKLFPETKPFKWYCCVTQFEGVAQMRYMVLCLKKNYTDFLYKAYLQNFVEFL